MTTSAFYSYPDTAGSEYMRVDEVARRLGIPVGLVTRRAEAGDVPARRVRGDDGEETWELRLADLGIEPGTLGGEDGFGYGYAEVSGVVEVTGSVEVSREEFAAIQEGDDEITTTAPAVDEDPIDVAQMVPPPTRDQTLSIIDGAHGPLADVAGMQIDPRELVAGLLDRWERTLEQRIYAEQRQRFENELVSRQTMVRELQMELRTVRAEHAAAQSDAERALAERERALADAERDLDQARRAAQQAQIQLQAQARKRRWFQR